MSGQDAAAHFNLVIERRVVQNMHGGVYCSCLRVVGAIDQRTDPGVDDGSRAHGARFDGYEEITLSQAVIAKGTPRLAQSDDLSMRTGVGIYQVAVESATDDFTFMNDDGANRNFAHIECSLSSPHRLPHPQFVVFRASAVWHEEYCMRWSSEAFNPCANGSTHLQCESSSAFRRR